MSVKEGIWNPASWGCRVQVQGLHTEGPPQKGCSRLSKVEVGVRHLENQAELLFRGHGT